MRAGCYSVDLYCEAKSSRDCEMNYLGRPAQYTGRSETDCLRQAKRDGWRTDFNKERCPLCKIEQNQRRANATRR